MATLLLTAAGAAIGGSALSGFSLFGTAIAGAQIGQAIGGIIGSIVDQSLFGPGRQRVEGPRLKDIHVQSSSEGTPIPEIFGRTRVAGQIIWATRFKEVSETRSAGGGGKGGGSKAKVTEYSYFASFAVGLCVGKISHVERIWADGKPLESADLTYRIYKGTDDQLPDDLIETLQGAGNSPAYRGLAYVVFEDLPLERFGNRVPQLSFEIIRSAREIGAIDTLEEDITGIALIPGSGEFALSTEIVRKSDGEGNSAAENVNNSSGQPDILASLDELEALAPNWSSTVLVSSWFGTDLRCGQCEIKPGVELSIKSNQPAQWLVSGVGRASAYLISNIAGGPAYGGTPSDRSILQAISELGQRGKNVVFYPFILMDIPADTLLPSPYDPSQLQPAYPWRGRITSDPAPGVAASADKTAQARTQISQFFGTATPGDYLVQPGSVSYTGPAEWGYRRMVLHYAHLCAQSSFVDAFIIGSELRGMTSLRDETGAYPAVEFLQSLAADVRSILGPLVKISYAADWSEYASHRPDDGTSDVLFNLDPLWSDPNIDFIGIDNYMPLADWRDSRDHLDTQISPSIYDLNYLQSNVEGGEGYDWYYASTADRDSQTRTLISDTAHQEDWVFRVKDIRNWWLSAHHDRPGGTRVATPTTWVPQSKPIWFTELGVPAIDKGVNQPNVFVDPKSSESTPPYYSRGQRDDAIQRQGLRAVISYWSDVANNPISTQYSSPMIDTGRIHIWAWDARPYPDFPTRELIWADGANWHLGHWLNGRLGSVPVSDLLESLVHRVVDDPVDLSTIFDVVSGYMIDRVMSPRSAIEPLLQTYLLDGIESGDKLRFVSRDQAVSMTVPAEKLAQSKSGNREPSSSVTHITAQESTLPVSMKFGVLDPFRDYVRSGVEARKSSATAKGISVSDAAIVMDSSEAAARAEQQLADAWTMRDRMECRFPPSLIALEIGDVVTIADDQIPFPVRLTKIDGEGAKSVEAVRTAPAVIAPDRPKPRMVSPPPVPVPGEAVFVFLDIPLLRGDEIPHAPHIAAYASPWPGEIALYASPTTANYQLDTLLAQPAVIGVLETDLFGGPVGRWDYGNQLFVRLFSGQLQSRPILDIFSGANVLAIENSLGEWEILQFSTAQLVGPSKYQLSGLLRGQGGTESALQNPVSNGARVVLVDRALSQSQLRLDQRGLVLNYLYGPASRPIDDSTYLSLSKSFDGVGLRPFSPVHLRAIRDKSSGDIAISWTRRTRIGGDSWIGEVPLGEEFERYALEILSGQTVVRQLELSTAGYTYPSSLQLADFGQPVSMALSLRLSQISQTFGPGSTRSETLAL